MDAASVQAALKQFSRDVPSLPVLTHTHIWWRHCGKATMLQQEALRQRHLGQPMLIPIHYPEDLVIPLHQSRPTILKMRDLRQSHLQQSVFQRLVPFKKLFS